MIGLGLCGFSRLQLVDSSVSYDEVAIKMRVFKHPKKKSAHIMKNEPYKSKTEREREKTMQTGTTSLI